MGGLILTAGNRVCERPWLPLVFAVGIAIRLAILPVTRGEDFSVWAKASSAVLRGINIYANHPDYRAGPYAYFPLFVYIELPFRWLSLNTGVPFTVLGKLPIIAGDLLTTSILALNLRDRGYSARATAGGAALFFLNPLVIENSAIYGRFDTLACGALLVALRLFRRGQSVPHCSAVWYAVAVAVKTFPGFVVLGLLRYGRTSSRRIVGTLITVLGLLSVPYMGTIRPYIHDILWYDVHKSPTGLSWQQFLLEPVGARASRLISYGLLVLFAMATVWLSRKIENLATYTLLTLLLFLLFSKVVLYQYLIWPLPWLLLALFTPRPERLRGSGTLLAFFTLIGIQMNSYVQSLSYRISIRLLLACAILTYVVAAVYKTVHRPESSRTVEARVVDPDDCGSNRVSGIDPLSIARQERRCGDPHDERYDEEETGRVISWQP